MCITSKVSGGTAIRKRARTSARRRQTRQATGLRQTASESFPTFLGPFVRCALPPTVPYTAATRFGMQGVRCACRLTTGALRKRGITSGPTQKTYGTDSMAANMKFSTILSEDRQTVTITLLDGETPLGHAIVEAPELEGMIELLAANRASMADPVSSDIEPLARLTTLTDPIWRTKIPSASPFPGVLLALRHPGFGWITSFLPRNEAQAMGESLLNLFQSP